MIRVRSRMCLAALAVSASLAALAPGQTVQVVTGLADNVTTFNTIEAALQSFNENVVGPNSGVDPTNGVANQALPNIVEVTFFGPFDETLTWIGNPSPAGLLPGPGIVDGTENFTVRAVPGVTPLLLLQANTNYDAGTDGWNIMGGAELVLEGLVIAASSNVPSDDLFQVSNENSRLVLTNCIITALDTTVTYTSLGDIATDLLDGTRGFDAALSRAGDNGFWIGGASSTPAGLAQVTLNATIVTQQGGTGTPDAFVGSTNSLITLNEGCLLANNNRFAVQTASNTGTNGANITVAGTAANPVVIRDHPNGQAIGEFIVKADINHLIVDNCRALSATGDGVLELRTNATRTDSSISIRNTVVRNISGSGSGLFLFKSPGAGVATYTLENIDFVNIPRFGINIFGNEEAVSLIENSRFVNCPGGGVFSGSDVAGTLRIEACTFHNAPIVLGAAGDAAAQPVEIVDTIVAGPGLTGIVATEKGSGTVMVTFTNLPLAGPQALAAQVDDPLSLVDITSPTVLSGDPEFLPNFDVFGDPNYMDVQACILQTANALGGPLAGGGVWVDPGTCSAAPAPGDADADGDIDVEDVTAIYNALPPLSIPLPLINGGDADGSGGLDPNDATVVINFLVDGTPIP